MTTAVTQPPSGAASRRPESPFPEVVSASGRPDLAELFVIRLRPGDDDSLVETVDGLDPRAPREEKWIINISTQYGCPLGCTFCDAGRRWRGDLTADEMLTQACFVADRHPGLASRCAKLKVHFARMGEPALNDAVIDALRRLPDLLEAPGLWACVPTAAPQGRQEWFRRLFEVKEERFRGRFQLQFSINTTDMAFRRRLMSPRLHDLDWMADYAHAFHQPSDRRVALNFALAQGSPFDADEIVRRFDPAHCSVKLTPLNPTHRGSARGLVSKVRPDIPADVAREAVRLTTAGFEVIWSIGDGREDELGSNCGQSVRVLLGL